MPENKTRETASSVKGFLDTIADEKKRKDAYTIIGIMKKITREEPKMWGGSIVGFGKVHYKYASGHSGETCVCGFSPRKQQFSLYLTCSIDEYKGLLDKLGKHKTGIGCLYIKKLSDVDVKVLEALIEKAVAASNVNS